MNAPALDFEAAQRHLELVTSDRDTAAHFRFINDAEKCKPAVKLYGTIKSVWPDTEAAQADGCGAFIVVNEGGNSDAEIVRIRACFIDADNVPLPDAWHLKPDFIVQRDDTHWHAYWRVDDCPVDRFREVQKRLAAHYRTDPAVSNPSRVMRLAGTYHQKVSAMSTLVKLIDMTGGQLPCLLGHTADEITTGLPDLPEIADAPAPSSANGLPSSPVICEAMLRCISPSCNRNQWLTVEAGLITAPTPHWDMEDRFDLFLRWSNGELHGETPRNFEGEEDCATEFQRDLEKLARGESIGHYGALVEVAREHGYKGQSASFDPQVTFAPFAAPEQLSAGYPPPKTAAELARGIFPRPEFVWQSFVWMKLVNLIYGDGGTGKTLLLLHLAVAVAAGRENLFGRAIRQMPVLIVLAEDDDGETKARLQAICCLWGIDLASLPIHIWALPGWDLNIARIADDGTWTPGLFMEPVRAKLREVGPCLAIFDTVSDFAALDETRRLPVNTLCKQVFGGFCREFGATVVVSAHPSKAAMADGSHYAGSTAWNNAVRNRLTLERGEKKGPRRILSVGKANYGGEEELELFLLGSTFRETAATGQTENDEREAVLAVVLDLIDKGVAVVRTHGQGQKPSDIAKAVHEKDGLTIETRRVLEILNAAERDGKLAYRNGGNSRRGQKAGFTRGENP